MTTDLSEEIKRIDVDEMTPRQIAGELDRYIVGQDAAKKAVAIAIRNRVRRRMLSKDLQEDIYPRNIIMIGPTGCGKTEIARRLSKLTGAPFVKVEATKYTEVGYVGRDVESMIRDLVNTSLNLVRKEYRTQVESHAKKNVRNRLLDLLVPSAPAPNNSGQSKSGNTTDIFKTMASLSGTGTQVQAGLQAEDNKQKSPDEERRHNAREMMARKLDTGELESREVEFETQASATPMVQIMGNMPNMEDMDMQVQNMLGDLLPKKQKRKRVTISEARELLLEEEVERLLDPDKLQSEAIRRAEQMGIIFVDEIDKICGRAARGGGGSGGPDVSREGVQRDLLPIVEGATIQTRNGPVKTDHILFIAAGAFHMSKPSDLIPELQGRFPIRVELEKLTEDDFRHILTGPRNSLTVQLKALMKTEGIDLEFASDGIDAIAHYAFRVNEETENIGARRLHTIMEKMLEELSFTAPELEGPDTEILIDRKFVEEKLSGIVEDRDQSRYIL